MFKSYKSRNKEYRGNELTFWEHLEELRTRLIRIAVVFICLSIIAFICKDIIFNIVILSPTKPDFITNRLFCHLGNIFNIPEMCINSKPVNLISITMSGQFVTHMNISVISGFVLSIPYIIWELWRFLVPALKPDEKKNISSIVMVCSVLFFAGILFSYYLIVPITIDFFTNYQVSETVKNQISILSFISSISSVTLLTGLLFELPVIIYFMTKIGIVTPQNLKKFRKYALIIILTLAAIVTPPDVISQLIVSVPLYGLFELSILISKTANASNEKKVLARKK